MNQNQANAFAAKWIEAWNAHDLDRILEFNLFCHAE